MAAQNGYANIHGWQLYDTTGTTEDWSYNATGGFGYTFEIGPNEFHPPYPEVVDQYLGAGKYAGKGNREAYLIALEHAVDTRYSGVLTGNAPKGAVIRLEKTFHTPTWESVLQGRREHRDHGGPRRLRVDRQPVHPAGGAFAPLRGPERQAVPEEGLRGRSDRAAGHVDHEFVLNGPADVLRTTLDWPTPDDLDLEVYRKTSDGKLKEVGSSGNFVGEKEPVDITAPRPAPTCCG